MISRKKNLCLLMIIGFLMVWGAFTVEAQKISDKKFKSWKISGGQTGVRNKTSKNYSLHSDGTLKQRNGLIETTRKVEESFLQVITSLILELNLPKAKTRMVKAIRIHDGMYSSFTITLDNKDYKIEGNSFKDEKHIVPTAKQQKTLEKLEEILTSLRTGQINSVTNHR